MADNPTAEELIQGFVAVAACLRLDREGGR
jgi:hypothetical protein